MTNEGLINLFPECRRIKKADVAECVAKVFDDVKFYREVSRYVRKHCYQLWPEPEDRRSEDAEIRDNYFYGDYDTKDFRFPEWIKSIEHEFVERKGQHRTFDEACHLAAGEWARMIFGTHMQNNGDQSNAGGLAMVFGTLAKDKAKKPYGEETIEKFRALMAEYYRDGCMIMDETGTWESEPHCDYHPNKALADPLIKAGCKEDDVRNMCPWKTGIHIDTLDNSVIIRGYQTERYL